MRHFCEELKSGSHKHKLKEYKHLVHQIADWYQDNYQRYAVLLQTEAKSFYEKMNDTLEVCTTSLEFTEKLTYNFSAKVSYFSVSDTLVKLILSCFSYGPTIKFFNEHELQYSRDIPDGKSWLEYNCNEIIMTEILAKVLKDNNINYSFDLQVLLRDRADRSKSIHSSRPSKCLSALRCYNTIRNMLLFLNEDYANSLQPFLVQDAFFDFNQFLSNPCNFNFTDHTTMLIVDSVHDIRGDYRGVVANLPWDVVIDLDGYSEYGGLLGAIKHNNIRLEPLNQSVIDGYKKTNHTFQKGQTLWYRCGNYQMPNYLFTDFTIKSYICFRSGNPSGNKREWGQHIQNIMRPLLERADRSERPINLVALTDDSLLVQNLINACHSLRLHDYFVTWIGLSNKDAEDIQEYWFSDDEEDMEEHFRLFVCPTLQFFEAAANHSSFWPVRTSLDSRFSLPCDVSGSIVIPENIRNQMANFFEPLYDNCETFYSAQEEELKNQFDSGGIATWNLIDNQYAIPLKDEKRVNRILNAIRAILGVIQIEPQKRLYFLRHKAGLGGTTFARQLAWKLHRDYATLCVTHYESGKIPSLIENLYDNVLEKSPIVLLADDTLPGLKNLCDDICRTERRCILIVSCRTTNNVTTFYPKSGLDELNVLDDNSIRQLKEHFKKVSPLQITLLEDKSNAFDTTITGEMCAPFIIGLYFFEEKFNIDEYVCKVLDSLPARRYADALAYIALGDRYGYKNIPTSLIKNILVLKPREDFLSYAHSADSLILSNADRTGVPCYSFKHYLLAQRYLEFYSQRYYPSSVHTADESIDLKNTLYHLTASLIEDIANLMERGIRKDSYLEFLIFILIQNKDDFDHRLSALMTDIGRTDSQIALLKCLADRFQPYAETAIARGEEEFLMGDVRLLRMVSHANAHLGRLYWREQRFVENAIVRSDLARKYMPYEDPDIYHMSGSFLMERLNEQCTECTELYKKQNVIVTAETFRRLELNLADAEQDFDDTCRFGSPEYGYPSKLKLYYQYLEFVYSVKEIKTSKDITLLSDNQKQIQMEFVHTLDASKSFDDFDQEATELIERYEGLFDANILFHDPSTPIQFYQNRVDLYRKDPSKILELNAALRGLIFARINSARIKGDGKISFQSIPNPERLQEDIESLLRQTYDLATYREYTLRSSLYHYWMQLAKVTQTSLETALEYALDWKELEEIRANRTKDPEPYYYLRAIYYLLYMRGAKNRLYEAVAISSEIQTLVIGKKFDSKRGGIKKIRDMIVVGKEMGQLLDVSSCINDEERMKIVAIQRKIPFTWDATFEGLLNTRTAQMMVFSPDAWNGEKVILQIGAGTGNTLSDEQRAHNIRFFAGYSVERLVAISDSAKDITSKELFDIISIVKQISKVPYSVNVHVRGVPNVTQQNRTMNTGKVSLDSSSIKSASTINKGKPVRAKIVCEKAGSSKKKLSFDVEFVEKGETFRGVIFDVFKKNKITNLRAALQNGEKIKAKVIGQMENGLYKLDY